MAKKDRKKEIIITGFGGQGIVMAGRVLGKAAAIGDHMESTLIQSYGPESRGGACSAQVVIADNAINYPYITRPDILIAMSQTGHDKFVGEIKDDGVVLIDQDLVKPLKKIKNDVFAVPATRIAEELGKKMMANIIMLGFVTAVTNVISLDAARLTVETSVPKGTESLNLNAFGKGCDYGLAIIKSMNKKAKGKAGVFK